MKDFKSTNKNICTCGYWNKDGSLNKNRDASIKYMHSKSCPSTLVDNTPNAPELFKALRFN